MTKQIRHPISEDTLAAIGDIHVSFALLEMLMKQLGTTLIDDYQDVGQTVFAPLSFKHLIGVLEALYTERNGNDPTDSDLVSLKSALKKATKLNEERNKVAHSVWASGPAIDHVTRIKVKAKVNTGLDHSVQTMSRSDLLDLANAMRWCATHFQLILFELIRKGKATNNPTRRSKETP